MRKVLAVCVLGLAAGCQTLNPEKDAIRETLWQGTRQIRANEREWAEKLVAYPVGTIDPRTGQPSDGKNQASEIKPLTPAQLEQDRKIHAELEAAYNEDVQRGVK